MGGGGGGGGGGGSRVFFGGGGGGGGVRTPCTFPLERCICKYFFLLSWAHVTINARFNKFCNYKIFIVFTNTATNNIRLTWKEVFFWQ